MRLFEKIFIKAKVWYDNFKKIFKNSQYFKIRYESVKQMDQRLSRTTDVRSLSADFC